jgi:hypothetical protein
MNKIDTKILVCVIKNTFFNYSTLVLTDQITCLSHNEDVLLFEMIKI